MKFDSFHPAVNLVYHILAFIGIVCFNHPAYVLISYLSMFFYSSLLYKKKGVLLNLYLIILLPVVTFLYASFNHFGVTIIGTNRIGNNITLESIVYGFVIAVKLVTIIMFFSCVFKTVTSDKIIYLFGKVSPRLSLFLSIILRTIPEVVCHTKVINMGRAGIGRGVTKGFSFSIVKNGCLILSSLITWVLDDIIRKSMSMKSRGYGIKKRTAFSIYRFDNRDRLLVIIMFSFITVIIMAWLLNQTIIIYNPSIILNRVTLISYGFYLIYAAFLLVPAVIHIKYIITFHINKKRA